ncbi:hypothetical protein MMC27_006010 [Xylographa pallens]|nr:hypothetical protein [Xylographa pallens]
MDHHHPAGYGAPSRPNDYGQPAPRHFPTEQWQQDHRDERQPGNGHPLVSNDYPVHQTPAQVQRYQQQLQALNRPSQQPLRAWDRPRQQQAYQQRLEGSSSHYAELYQSQSQYLQAPGYGSLQYSHVPEEYGYTNQDGSNTQPEQSYREPHLMQQHTLQTQSSQFNGYLDPRRTRPPPQNSYSEEGSQQRNDRKHLNNTRPSAPQGQQISYTNDEPASSMSPPAPQGQQIPYTTGGSTDSMRSAAPQGQHAPYINGDSLNNIKPRDGQVKSAKARILASPISPETISWDNPFPTFPTNKKKPTSHDTDGQRPATASSSRSHESARAQPASTIGVRDQNAGPPELEQGSIGSLPTIVTGRGHLSQEATRKPENGYHTNFGQQKPLNGIMQLEKRSNESYSLPSSPWQSRSASGTPNYKPSHAYELDSMTHSSLPYRLNGPAPQPNRVYKEHPLQQQGHDILYQPPNHAETRSADYGRSHSLDLDLGLHTHDGQFQQPLHRPPQVVDGSYDDHLDSYYEPVHEHIQPQSNQQTQLSQSIGDEDMPNFKARADERFGHGSSMTMDPQLHHGPQQPALTSFPTIDTDHHGRFNDQTRTAGLSGQAQRSRSQPNYRDRRPMNQNEGFMPGAAAHTPPLPALNGHAAQFQSHGGYADISSSKAPQRPFYRANQHSNGSRRESPLPQRSRQNQANSLPVIQTRSSIDSRMSNSGQGSSPVEYSSKDTCRGPASPLADERPSMSPLSGRSQGPSQPPGNTSRPPSAPVRRPPNPDALPEHPSPIRAGPASAINVIQPKPPPVRQYNRVATPTGQPNISQQAQPRRSGGNMESVPVTHEELRHLGQLIKAQPNDQKTQLLLAQKMVEAASVLADEGGRADAKTRNKNREKYIFDAHKLVKKLVSGGYPEAMFYLADCHGRGLLGLQADPKEAFSIYQSAAKLGHAQSAYRVAVCCEMGQEDGGGTRKDPLKAVQWYKRAATLGDSPAMYKMGMIQLKGLLGQPKNIREAVVWLKRAAERADEENPHALHELGLLYESASGNDNIIRDEAYSNQLFLQAAELGYKFSQYRLGSAYEYGHLGCPIDPRQSIAWYSKAAVQEEHQSELALSGWYLTGAEGVLQQSDTEAYLWARKAALAGLAKAEYAMGYFTEVGIGATANMEDAKRWYWRASSQNFPKARERLEDLRKGGARMQKSRVSRSAVNKQSETDCSVM